MVLALVVVLALSGCINFKEELWFNADGTGKFSIDIGMSQSLIDMAKGSGSDPFEDFKKEFEAKDPLVKNVSGKEYSDKVGGQDMKHYVITAEITDMFKYMEQQSKNSNETMNITVKKLENGNFSFTQNLAMGDNSGLPTSGVDAKSLQSFLKDMYWTVVVHVPSVVSADKTAKVSGGTVEWAIPIGDVMAATKPIELKLEYSPKGGGDFPTWIIFVIVGVVVVALIVVGVLLFLRRRKPAPAVDYSAYGYPPYIDPNAPPQPPAEGQPPYPPQAPGGQQ
jgi:hypothetical protein